MNTVRSRDCFDQADRELKSAVSSMHASLHEMACLSARHSVEQALHGLFLALRQDTWGLSIRGLIQQLETREPLREDLRSAFRDAEEWFLENESEAEWGKRRETNARLVIGQARIIVEFCKNYLAGS